MKLLFDENLSPKLVRLLAGDYPGSAHVYDVGLLTSPDPDIWNFAAANDMLIVSKDTDFQQRSLTYGAPPKVIWIRLGNCTTAKVATLLTDRLADLLRFEADSQATFLVIS